MIGKYSDEMTFDYIMNRMLESVPDTVDKREGSIIYDALAPAAAELVKCYMELDVVMDETFVDTASLQYLMLRCKERGVAIQGETAAVIEGVFTPPNVELTAGLRFNCDEVNYTITEKISVGHYKLEAETLGTVGNKYTGLLLPIQTVNGWKPPRLQRCSFRPRTATRPTRCARNTTPALTVRLSAGTWRTTARRSTLLQVLAASRFIRFGTAAVRSS